MSTSNKNITKKSKWLLLVLIASLVLIGFIRVESRVAYNSDDVAIQNITGSWQQAGVSKSWLGTDNYIGKIPFYFVMNKAVANPAQRLNYTSFLLVIAAFLLFSLWLVQSFGVSTAAGLCLCLLASNSMLIFLMRNPNVRNIEVGLSFWLLSGIGLISRGVVDRRNLLLGAAIAFVSGLFLYNDPFFVYMLFVPLLVYLAIQLVRARRGQQRLPLALSMGVILLAVAFSKGISFVGNHLGFISYSGDKAALTDIYDVPHKVSITIRNYFELFNATPAHHIFNANNLRFISASLVAILIGALTFKYLVKFARQSPHSCKDAVLAICSLVIVSDCLIFIGTRSTALHDTRYLILLPFLATPLLTDYLQNLQPKFKPSLVVILLLATILNLLFWQTPNANSLQLTNINPVVAQLSGQYKKGYAPYWSANVISYFSDRQKIVTSITCNDKGQLGTYYWLTTSGDLHLSSPNSFLVYDRLDPALSACTLGSLGAQFGPPQAISRVDSRRLILKYSYDIRDRFVPTLPTSVQKFGS